MWFLLLWALGLVYSGIDFWILGGIPEDIHELSRILLLGQFVITFGLLAIIGMITNVFCAKTTAKKLNWPGGPFQIKYGFSQLCLGVMGVMCLWFHGNFWAATVVNMYMYGLSGFWTHTQEMMKNKKPDVSNVCNLIMNALYQAFITILSIWVSDVWIFGS